MSVRDRQIEKYQVMPDMPAEQFEALKADIAERGVMVPIDIDEHGNFLDGHHRYRACVELGITDFPTCIRKGLSDEQEARAFARRSNVLRRHLTRKQTRALVADQLRDTPKWANNRIGRMLGVSDHTVRAVREELEAGSQIAKVDTLIGTDGKSYPRQRKPAVAAKDEPAKARDGDETAPDAPVPGVVEHSAPDPAPTTSSPPQPSSSCKRPDGYDDPAFGLNPDDRDWWLFTLWNCGDCFHDKAMLDNCITATEWILRRDYTNPDEWMDDDAFRARCGMRRIDKKTKRHWRDFKKAHKGWTIEDAGSWLRAVNEINTLKPTPDQPDENACFLEELRKKSMPFNEWMRRLQEADTVNVPALRDAMWADLEARWDAENAEAAGADESEVPHA